MAEESSLSVVEAWQDAANSKDLDRLLELSDSNIEVTGPRGSGYGHQLLLDWLARSGLTFKTLRVFARGKIVVVAQHGTWHSPETGEPTGEADFASHFQVDSHQVTHIARYDTLDEALDKAGLTYSGEIPQ